MNYTSLKLKTFVLQRIPPKKRKEPTEWEKLFAEHISDKNIFKILEYFKNIQNIQNILKKNKNLLQLNNKKTTQLKNGPEI